MSEFVDASFACLHSVFKSHVSLEVVVQNRVNKVTCISLSSLVHLLKCAQVVHPVQLRTLLLQIEPSNQHIHVIWSFSQSSCELCPHVLGCGFDAQLKASSVFLELQIALDVVCELVAVILISSSADNLELVEVHNLILVVLKSKDTPVDSSVCHYDDPVLSCNTEYSVHVLLY